MTRRKQWISIVFAALFLFGGGGCKKEEPAGFYLVGGQLMAAVKGADGKRYYVLVGDDFWQCDGASPCLRQAKPCPTCGPCNCTLKICSPWCFVAGSKEVLDPKQFPGLPVGPEVQPTNAPSPTGGPK